jgi:flavin reductase (DIM6/NTAB) family NADH-FMN oxidoreductase RutF
MTTFSKTPQTVDVAALDPARLRSAFACFPSGVVGLCAMVGGGPAGMAASSFTSVSLDPPLVSVCVAHTSTTWPVLRRAPRLGVSVLSIDGGSACRRLAAKGIDRFAGLGWTSAEHGSLFLDDAVLHLDCTVCQEVPAGDHNIVVLQVHELAVQPGRGPLVFHASRFRQLIDV